MISNEPSEHGSAFVLEKGYQNERRILPRGASGSKGASHITKRSAVPPCPGDLGCAVINDQINTDGALSDDDPYSDRELTMASVAK
jgi:hypothetical protein